MHKGVNPRERSDMTQTQQLIFDFIRTYLKTHGEPPSDEVIAKGVGLKSKSNIHRIVHKLEEEGYLRVKPYKVKSIKLIDSSAQVIGRL